jgi:hypothetical protein
MIDADIEYLTYEIIGLVSGEERSEEEFSFDRGNRN